MSLKSTIEQQIKTAMLSKDKDRLRALRSIKSLILLAETEKGHEGELSEEVANKLLVKAAKQRRDSLEIFHQQGRADLAAVEQSELEVIESFLPKQMTEAELELALKEIIKSTGATGPSDMGKVMGAATKELSGKSDGKAISLMVKKLLTA